jgi:hypothetical protein
VQHHLNFTSISSATNDKRIGCNWSQEYGRFRLTKMIIEHERVLMAHCSQIFTRSTLCAIPMHIRFWPFAALCYTAYSKINKVRVASDASDEIIFDPSFHNLLLLILFILPCSHFYSLPFVDGDFATNNTEMTLFH